jgi:uncharacterized membrane protein YraQ (UPF0718 family)
MLIIEIINFVFSLPYLLIGFFFAALLDIFIHRKKASKRLTLIEIWGFAIGWPIIILFVVVVYFSFVDD